MSYLSSIRIFSDFLSRRKKHIIQIDTSDLKAYIDYLLSERRVSYPTLESHFSALSAFYDWLVFEDELPANPVLAVRKRYFKRYKG